MTLESKLQALVAHWKAESKRIKEMADKERSKASKDSLMAQSVRYWMCADELIEALLTERQEPPALTAREGVATQMADDILLRIAKRYANCEVNIYPDCPELTPVEAVLRCAKEEGFHLTNAAAPSSGTGESK